LGYSTRHDSFTAFGFQLPGASKTIGMSKVTGRIFGTEIQEKSELTQDHPKGVWRNFYFSPDFLVWVLIIFV
jgi:hypothetical protein